MRVNVKPALDSFFAAAVALSSCHAEALLSICLGLGCHRLPLLLAFRNFSYSSAPFWVLLYRGGAYVRVGVGRVRSSRVNSRAFS